jgi:hypothetical protein
MGKVKTERQSELDKLHFDYAECKIEMDEFISKLTALGINSPADIKEHKLDAEEARYDYKVSQHQNKF